MSNKALTKVMSSIMRVRQDDGTFIPIFPINTINDVYADINNDVKLSTFLENMSNATNVASMDDLYKLTQEDVKLLDIVKVDNESKLFIVIDTIKLDSKLGYLEILTGSSLGAPDGIPQLDSDGKLPMENLPQSIEFITYTSNDIPV